MIIPNDMSSAPLVKRYYNCDAYGNNCYYSSWNSWQRWVLLGILIVAAIIFFLTCACCTSRRRRARGLQPYYGTGWANWGPPPAYDFNRPTQPPPQPHTGPQFGGQTSSGWAPQYPQQEAPQYPPNYPPNYPPRGGEDGEGYEMNGYNRPTNGPYQPPSSPPPAHTSKY